MPKLNTSPPANVISFVPRHVEEPNSGREKYPSFPEWVLPVDVAKKICGGLSNPSKMPGYSYSISAKYCRTGSILRNEPDTTCSRCYAHKGHYSYRVVQNAMQRRYDSLGHPQWVAAVTSLILYTNTAYFRWHDSGDVQNSGHLLNIIEVARRLPVVRFWMPTRENWVVRYLAILAKRGDLPSNLLVRLSAAKIDMPAPSIHSHSSQVSRDMDKVTCPARFFSNACGPCRQCWDASIPVVVYPLH